jgi:hypothetical protein
MAGPMSDRLLTEEEYKALLPWRCVQKGEIFLEIGGERVFIPRRLLIQIFQRHSEVMAGLACQDKPG